LHRTVDGQQVDLGRVGIPSDAADVRVVALLAELKFVPVIACIGLGVDGRLFNVNADTFAGHLAARLRARRLVIAGTTPGVLDDSGSTVQTLEPAARECRTDEYSIAASPSSESSPCPSPCRSSPGCR